MAAAAPDRLSDLPDDLLIHILSFAPFREAARTTALSRRWRRPLWRETGVVLLDHRSYITTSGGVPHPRRMVEDADRAHAFQRLRKVTIIMHDEFDQEEEEDDLSEAEEDCDGLEELRTEEIRLEWLDCTSPAQCRHVLYPGSLPYAALRVLELTGYILQPDSDGRRRLAFPCLEAMWLRRCRTAISTLHDIIFSAPRLADVRLEAVCLVEDQQEYHLHCPKATDIDISDLHVIRSRILIGGCPVKLDAPCVRRLRYANVVTFEETNFSFVQHLPPNLQRVHLAVHSGSTRATLLRRLFLTSVRHIRFLKLTAYSMADLDDITHICFVDLERLEIEDLCGWSIHNDRGVASALVNLLDRCPGVRELQLKYSWREYLVKNADQVDQMAASSDFSLCRSLANDEEDCCNRLELHELRGRCDLKCLRTSMRKVVLEFDTEELTCLQVRLIKFIGENAMVLEEFIVDGGKGYDSSHIEHKIARWQQGRRSSAAARDDYP